MTMKKGSPLAVAIRKKNKKYSFKKPKLHNVRHFGLELGDKLFATAKSKSASRRPTLPRFRSLRCWSAKGGYFYSQHRIPIKRGQRYVWEE